MVTLRTPHPAGNAASTPLGGGVSPRMAGAYPISRQAERRGRALLNWVAEVMLPDVAALNSRPSLTP
jgi:hypothetical protein